MAGTRREHDSLGEVEVPEDARYGAQTQRAIDNFRISGRPVPTSLIRAVASIKAAAARANARVAGGAIDDERAAAIQDAAEEVARGDWADQFPIDVFQTGSGTSTNMNVNEVLAHRAAEISGLEVHPNDHVNASQSSNDV
ncbi:MAG TPA: lyase family protein, partial [Microthrixaceae bacterium]|nr:lyase family protein [Microthrixaceae bacterium]